MWRLRRLHRFSMENTVCGATRTIPMIPMIASADRDMEIIYLDDYDDVVFKSGDRGRVSSKRKTHSSKVR